MKRFLSVLCVLFIIAVLLAGGFFAARKLYSMYKNIWDTLDRIAIFSIENAADLSNLSEDVDSLSTRLYRVSSQVDHLHKQTFYSQSSAHSEYDYSWIGDVPPYIAHACGGIDGVTYTNSREAFIRNYEAGQRVFEIDFNLCEDGSLVASHDEDTWRQLSGSNLPYTSEHFSELPLTGGYDSLTGREVIDLLSLYPDAYLVTDTKDTSKANVMLAFSQLVHYAEQTHPEVLSRIIPQIYHEEMLPWITSIYPFRSIILTLYQLRWTPESILDFCMNSGVRFITMPYDQVSEEALRLWDTLGIHVAVHTINDPEIARTLFDMGVDMLYTDTITPN